MRSYGALEPKVVRQELLAISFANNGTVSNIERFSMEDGQIITLNRRVTDLPVRGPTLLQQIFGNFGNFNARDLITPN